MDRLNILKHKIADFLGQGVKSVKGNQYFDLFIEVLVLLNVAAIILESIEPIEKAFSTQFQYFEIFTVTIFSTEFILRLWVSNIRVPNLTRWQAYKRHLSSITTIIDLVAILPFFIPFMINIDLRHLRVFRLVRLLRVFKLTKYSHAIILIGKILSEKRQELFATLFLMFSVLITASSFMYYLEREAQPDVFPNILHAFWWGIVTLTTVGYGDTYPITAAGKFLGGFVAMMGVMIVAIPIAIISSSFVQKMEETKSRKRMSEIRNRLKEAYFKKYIPELACKIRRGQLSVDAVKVNLELAENDIYKIAEGKNEFRFRYKKVITNGRLVDKLFLEYREINTEYGTFTNRGHHLSLVSPESLNKQSIGYLVYCMSEKLRCNYVSNEFYGDEADVTEESFGDKGLEPDSSFNFRHNKNYSTGTLENTPDDFLQWKKDIASLKKDDSFFVVFNTFEQDPKHKAMLYLTYFKNKDTGSNKDVYTVSSPEKMKSFAETIENSVEERYGHRPEIIHNDSHFSIRDNNILTYLTDSVGSNALLISINEDFITNEKLFAFAAILSDAVKENILGVKA